MPRPHQRRFRFFLKQLKAGEVVLAPAARRQRSPARPEPVTLAEERRRPVDATPPLVPAA